MNATDWTVETREGEDFLVLRVSALSQVDSRWLQGMVDRGNAAHWLRRASDLDAACPRPDDYNGRATELELAQRARRCQESAAACRERAELLTFGETLRSTVDRPTVPTAVAA